MMIGQSYLLSSRMVEHRANYYISQQINGGKNRTIKAKKREMNINIYTVYRLSTWICCGFFFSNGLIYFQYMRRFKVVIDLCFL